MLERQVFQAAHDAPDAQTVCDGRVNLQRLFRNPLTLLRREELQRLHVMHPVGEFDQDDAHILGGG